jgi:hypothetical protein
MLGIHHTLVWNRFFQNDQRWLLQVMLWGLLRAGDARGRCTVMDCFIHLKSKI